MSGNLRTTAFVQALAAAGTDLDVVSQLIEREAQYLRCFRTTPASLRGAITPYRKAVSSADLPFVVQQWVKEHFHVTEKEQTGLKKEHLAKVVERQESTRLIYDVDAYVRKGDELLKSSSKLNRIIALCWLTGRRIGEITAMGTFHPHPEMPETWVMFGGQEKTGTRGDIGTYPIPVIGYTDGTVVVQALEQLRRDLPQYKGDNQKAHSAYNSDANEKVKKLVEGLLEYPEDTTMHDLRKAYAEIAYHIRTDRKAAKPIYLTRILGHANVKDDSNLSYYGYTIAEHSDD
jgi:integrase